MVSFRTSLHWLRFPAAGFVLVAAQFVSAAPPATDPGRISGSVVESANLHPVEFARISLRRDGEGTALQTTVSNARGEFSLVNVPFGDFTLSAATLDSATNETRAVHLDAAHPTLVLPPIALPAEPTKMDALVVTSSREAQLNSIDRKVYNVGKDLLSAAGSASDLLQNVPSVSVDLDGQVSLRGSSNVLILIDGRTSTLMGANRGAVLEQTPAESIERIEVITNPSAKYKPDGTAGIINLVTKKKRDPGFTGSLSVNVGNAERANTNLTLGFNPGRWNISGNFALRKDDRLRTTVDVRDETDPATHQVTRMVDRTTDYARPLSQIARGGAEFKIDEQNTVGAAVNYNHRTFDRRAVTHTLTTAAGGTVTEDADRNRFDPEYENELEFKGSFQHAFADEGHELNFEFKADQSSEQEDNHYTNVSRRPAAADAFDNVRITAKNRGTEFVSEYAHPLGQEAKFEAGYTRETGSNDQDFHAEFRDAATGTWVTDTSRSNRFRADSTVHAGYATYGRTLGRFGFLGGARIEQAFIDSLLVNTGVTVPNDYFRLYPSLHLTYELADSHEVQLNYSHRIHRPELDDLNPFPEYQDPTHLRAGNPRLRPEDIHSFELGHQFKRGDTSFITTAYYRYLYHGLTDVTTYVTPTTLLTTRTNLSTSRSLGLELAANSPVTKWATLNFSSNTFFNTIDASNLGFADSRSAVSWMAKLGVTVRPAKATLLQLNTNYTSSKLTPQGRRGASFITNFGLRQEIMQNRAALTLTVSDVFNSLKETTVLDTPGLHEEITRRRSARIAYVGCLWKFGKVPKKAKDETMRFDEAL